MRYGILPPGQHDEALTAEAVKAPPGELPGVPLLKPYCVGAIGGHGPGVTDDQAGRTASAWGPF